eukprot:TRINITY_DN32414_c0_g1_i1.p2 TRINITY_DN32414_c0_g1~~TRINITY_DN32414_c0_g1_i1.p2  ORF type:complete len:208 (-),score=31.42 TRINITY_DN32414_c0_g1_i1:291-914(-)
MANFKTAFALLTPLLFARTVAKVNVMSEEKFEHDILVNKDDGKWLVLFDTIYNCEPCATAEEMFEAGESELAQDSITPVRVLIEKSPMLKKRFGIKEAPQIALIHSEGRKQRVYRYSDKYDADTVLTWVKSSLDGSIEHEKMPARPSIHERVADPEYQKDLLRHLAHGHAIDETEPQEESGRLAEQLPDPDYIDAFRDGIPGISDDL